MKPNQPYYVTIKLLESLNKSRRPEFGDEIRGLAPSAPEVGMCFFMYTHEGKKYIRTSRITSIDHVDDTVSIKTKNSVYVLSNIEEAKS